MNNKKIFSLLVIASCLLGLSIHSADKLGVNAASDDKKVQIFARNGQNEGIVKVLREYDGLNIKWKKTTSYSGLHVRVIGSVIPDEGKDYVDLSQYTRLEFEVREGSTKEYFAPTYIDSDGTYTIVGSGDGNVKLAGSKIDCYGALTYPNNYDYNGQTSTMSYSGSPVYMTPGKDDFANYHFNITNKSVKTYDDWRKGLNLNPNGEGDHSKVKCFAMNFYKSDANRNFDWNFSVLKVYGRDNSGNRKLIFDASKAVMTNSISNVWNDMKDSDGNSYVFVQNNLGSYASDFQATVGKFSGYTGVETQVGNSFQIVKKNNGGAMWGWSRLVEAEKGAVVNCEGYDAAVFELNNTTGHPIQMKPRYDYVDANGGTVNCEAGQLTLVGEDGSVSQTVDYVIPAGFKGTVYSFFSHAQNNFASNLAKVKNDFRMVITINDNNNLKTFELSNYRFTKTGLAQYKEQVISALTNRRNAIDTSELSVEQVNKLDSIYESVKSEINGCSTFNNIRAIYNAGVEKLPLAQLSETLERYYNGGTYIRTTVINLNEDAKNELVSCFHAECNILDRVTTFDGESLWMSHGANGDGKYSFYGSSEEGMTNAIVNNIGETSSKVVIKGTSMEDYYTTMKDISEKALQYSWTKVDNVWSSSDEEVIKMFLDFTAPCFLGLSGEKANYFSLDHVEVEEVGDSLVLRLVTTGDSGKLTDINGVLSVATITK